MPMRADLFDVVEQRLTPPEVMQKVDPRQTIKPLSEASRAQLVGKLMSFIDDLVAQDPNSPIFDTRVEAIIAIGQKEIREATAQSNHFLQRPVTAMGRDSHVGTSLAALRNIIDQLDPNQNADLKTTKWGGMLSKKPNVQGYFDSYKNSQTHINVILGSLNKGKLELIDDNLAISEERKSLWNAMGRLEQMAMLSRTMDELLEQRIKDLQSSDPRRAQALRESALFYCRQRSMDLLTQLAVSMQGYMALDQVKKNNVELIKGVDRASTTTVSALRTAVTVAQSLTAQKLVLDQITTLNSTTASVIDSTGVLMKGSTLGINEDASSASVPLETLKRAFQNVYDTMDSIETFKSQALDNMQKTVELLSGEVEKSQTYLARGNESSVVPGPEYDDVNY